MTEPADPSSAPTAERADSSSADSSGSRPERSLSTGQGIAYASGTIGMSLFPAFLASWQMYFFSPPADSGRTIYASAVVIGTANLIGQIVHSFADGIIGHASDRTHTRWGRRVPWIVGSSPILALSFAAIWWPWTAGDSLANVAWLVVLRAIMWIAYTGTFGPYSSLLAELTEGASRIRVSVFMALFEVVGTISATAGAGWMIQRFQHGVQLGGLHFSDGFKVAGVVAAVVGLVAILVSVSAVRERPDDESKHVGYSLKEALLHTLANPAFRPYVAGFVLYRIGLLAILTLLPYQVQVVLGFDDAEDRAGLLQMIIVLGAVLLFPLVDRLSRTRGKRKVMLWGFFWFAAVMGASGLIGQVPGPSPEIQAYAVYAFATFPVATLLVLCRPILADIIDHDEKLTGFRREGMYNGAEGMLTKAAEGVGPLVAAILFTWFGSTRAEPFGVILVGPVAGLLVLMGGLFFRRYPLE